MMALWELPSVSLCGCNLEGFECYISCGRNVINGTAFRSPSPVLRPPSCVFTCPNGPRKRLFGVAWKNGAVLTTIPESLAGPLAARTLCPEDTLV